MSQNNDLVVYGEPVNSIVAKILANQHGIVSGNMHLICINDVTLFDNRMNISLFVEGNSEPVVSECVDGKFSIPECKKGAMIKIVIPCQTPRPQSVYRLKTILYYTSEDGKKRLYNSVEKVRLAGSLGISHNLLFPNPEFALLRLDLKGENEAPIRVISINLESPVRVINRRLGTVPDKIVRDLSPNNRLLCRHSFRISHTQSHTNSFKMQKEHLSWIHG